MNVRRIFTVVLLLFVAASVGYLVAGNRKGKDAVAEARVEPAAETGHKIMAYYFHGNSRCKTCRGIEAETYRVLQQNFPEALKNGTLVWKTVNIDRPENQHYFDEFQFLSRIVVIADVQDGKTVRWDNLDKVWQLYRDRPAFDEYIRSTAAEYVEQVHG